MLTLPSSQNTKKLHLKCPTLKSPSIRLYLKALLVVILLACFLVQVRDGFYKFVAGQTTLVSIRKTAKSDTLPTISFCPGFKDQDRDYYDRVEDEYKLLEEQDDQTPLEAWNKDTYDLSEMILMIKKPGAWDSSADTHPDHLGYYEDLNMTIVEVSTVYGRCFARCFALYFDWTMDTSGQYFSIKFNMSSHAELFIYVHEKYDEVGLHWGFWPINPIQHVIHGNADYTFKLQKNLFKPLENYGCMDDEDYSYPGCVVRWARRKFVDMFKEEGGDNATACWNPTSQYLALNSGLAACDTQQDSAFARATEYSSIHEHLNNPTRTGCARRCEQRDYRMSVVREPNVRKAGNDFAFVYLEMSLTSDHVAEILVYDLNTIVASIGGSLGLFLGVSFFSMSVYLAKKCSGRIKI